jgi:hypothetical protein
LASIALGWLAVFLVTFPTCIAVVVVGTPFVQQAAQPLLDLWQTRNGVITNHQLRVADLLLPRPVHERFIPAEPGHASMLAVLWTIPSEPVLRAAHARYQRRRSLVFSLIVVFGVVASVAGGIALAAALIGSLSP